MELRALGRICQGEELTISYVDVLNLSADRQKQLKERFHFDCSCDHCSRHVGDDLMAAAAEAKVSETFWVLLQDVTFLSSPGFPDSPLRMR